MNSTPITGSAPHSNRHLFSDHYLDERLPQHPAWLAGGSRASELMKRVASILGEYNPSPNEAPTEKDLVQPVLDTLGWHYEVQAPLAASGRTVRPDYVFYRDAPSVAAAKGKKLSEGKIEGGLAVGDAKHWDRPLDQATGGGKDAFSNQNPGFQIAYYLQHSGLPWGILTNGRLWRLYHRDSAHRLDHYYEIDLPAIVERGDPLEFQYFSHFFGPEASTDGALSLDALLRESADYARGVSKGLKAQVYDALWHAAEGFLAHVDNDLEPRPSNLSEVHANALVLLYRLLFVLFAEAKGLLPLRSNEMYRRQYSLDAIKKDLAPRGDDNWARDMVTLWPRLVTLFRAIDGGSPSLGVPAFNGGLFNPQGHPALETWVMGDAAVASVIDLLARVDGEFVDYRDLASSHLGTIYEGLLEYHLRLNPEAEMQGWTTELVTSKGERRASGSYYTPGYITRLMTERTLAPIVDAALTETAGQGAEATSRAILEIDVVDPAMGSGHFLVEAIDYLAERLVAADVLPEHLRTGSSDEPGVERSQTGLGIDELAYWKRRVAQSSIYGVDRNPLAVELAKLSIWLATAAGDRPLSFLDHHLRCGNSLVGTNLESVQSGKPESVRSARSRRAAQREAESLAAGQLSWLEDDSFRRSLSTAVDSMWLIEEHASDTVDDVREQSQLYESLRERLHQRFTRLADLVTAGQFGLEIEPELWKPLQDLVGNRQLAAAPRVHELLESAIALADNWRFFHWELAFPEVFFDRHGESLGEAAGFAAVLGNPPYIRQEGLGDIKRYFQSVYPETFSGVADIYVYFYQRGYELLQAGGRMSYIVTNKWLRAGYGEGLRAYFAETGAVEELIDFGHAPIFEDADVFPCILWLERPRSSAQTSDDSTTDTTTRITDFPREALDRDHPSTEAITDYVAAHAYSVPRRRFGADPWNLEPQPVVDLMDKIRRNGIPLVEFAGVKPYYGIKTGYNEAFLIDTPTRDRLVREDPRSAQIIKPYLRGQDIKRWSPEWAGLWMIALASSENRKWPWSAQTTIEAARSKFAAHLPAVHEHLSQYEDRLIARQDKGVFWWELRSCTYYDVFERPSKLIHTDITWRSQFAVDATQAYLVNTAYVWPISDPWILAVLNSPTLWPYMWRNAMHGKDEALRLIFSFVETIPIAQATESIRAHVDAATTRLIAITRAEQEARRALLDWLRVEYDIETPGRKLEDFGSLSDDEFVTEVRRRRPRSAGGLTPAGLKELRSGFAELVVPVREEAVEASRLEQRVAELVNDAYGLTPEEVALMWRTAPPRMPVGPPSDLEPVG